jgi:hypothetical protein
MAARTIVTSQPDVACEVCGRRLLRGEQPDVFVVAGQRRIVCELCAPRAAHEGWLRESEAQAVTLPPMRPRRGRSFLERLRQVGRPSPSAAPAPGEEPELEPFDFLAEPEAPLGEGDAGDSGRSAGQRTPIVPARRRAQGPLAADRAGELADREESLAHLEGGTQAEDSYLAHALAVFNASEFPRRVAGVARSLGAPEVSVRSAEHLESVVRIVVAWELCWYRYEVDLSDGPGEACQLEQGTELSELPREDRLENAVADDAGALVLLAG